MTFFCGDSKWVGAGPGQRDQWRDMEKGRGWENQTSNLSLELNLQWGSGPRGLARSRGRVPSWLPLGAWSRHPPPAPRPRTSHEWERKTPQTHGHQLSTWTPLGKVL